MFHGKRKPLSGRSRGAGGKRLVGMGASDSIGHLHSISASIGHLHVRCSHPHHSPRSSARFSIAAYERHRCRNIWASDSGDPTGLRRLYGNRYIAKPLFLYHESSRAKPRASNWLLAYPDGMSALTCAVNSSLFWSDQYLVDSDTFSPRCRRRIRDANLEICSGKFAI